MSDFSVAIVKPDHLGDFILALPAIRALQAKGMQITLFIATGTFFIARHYFPNAELVALDLPYLKRDGSSSAAWSNAYLQLGKLRDYDLVLFFRRDDFLAPSHFHQWTDHGFYIEDKLDRHQSLLEYDVVSQIVGPYDIDNIFFSGRKIEFPRQLNTIVFAVGTGFPLKKWSSFNWVELAHALTRRGCSVKLLSGSAEIGECELIARASQLDEKRDIFVGSADLTALGQWLEDSDLVVAVDGGSAHLCSLHKPIIGLFGPSPYRRYAPIGRMNRVLTRDLTCSPCVGFHLKALNACMSRECLLGLRPQHVLEAVELPPGLPGECVELNHSGDVKVRFGVSASGQ